MRIFFASLLFVFVMSSSAVAATMEDDIAHYVKIFSGETSAHQEAVESLAWMGISDHRLFDIIEQRVLEEAPKFRHDRNEKNRVARYIRALGFSGDAKYVPTIQKFLSDPVYERYSKTALEDLANYRKWNPIISNRASFNPAYGDDVNRILNMLRAEDPMLKRIAAKRIYFDRRDEVLLDMLSAELKAAYVKANPAYTDVTAWMVKALGNAKNPKYRPLIQEVAAKSTESKVVSYAKAALESY